jgi:hypothetical protein
MSSQALGTIYRSSADILDAHVPGLNAAIEKLRQKILKRLAAMPNIRDSFDRAWSKAATTRARIQAAMRAMGRIANKIGDMGDIASPELHETHAELITLLDVLRMLLWIEEEAKRCRDLANKYGY